MKKNKIVWWGLGSVLVVGLVAAALLFWVFPQKVEEWKIEKKLQGHDNWVEVYKRIQGFEQKRKENPKDVVALLVNIGFEWKTLGDLSNDMFFYQKALDAYKQGIEQTGKTNIAFYWNAGKVAEHMNDFVLAENFYKDAIKISPTYNESYGYLAELYMYKMHKTDNEILQVYADGLKGTQGDANLFLQQCSYLKQVKRTKDAVECYEHLSKNFPDNVGFKQTIVELKKQL